MFCKDFFFFRLKKISKFFFSIYLTFSQLRICRPLPSPPLKSGQTLKLHERCGMCWIITYNKKILRFVFFELSRNFIENWGDDVTKTTIPQKKLEKSEIWFYFRFSRLRIFHVNLITLKKWFWCCCSMQFFFSFVQNFNFFFFKNFIFFFKFTWKIHNRLNWKKNQISDSSDFYLSSYGNFCDITPIFDEISR